MINFKEQAALFKALAHPVRLEILTHLCKGPSCANKTNQIIPGLSQPNLSQHLKTLKAAGIIDSRVDGTRRCYFICRPSIAKAIMTILYDEHPYQECRKPEQK